MSTALDSFDPRIRTWFNTLYPAPTQVQTEAWPRIQTGEHLLITAPTGTGKTMTAFLWTLNRFLTGELAMGSTRVLYVSPLKALNNDILQNLLQPLAELSEQNPDFPAIRVQTRSGDTEQSERRRMIRNPPEILITTPESLNLLLSSKSGLGLLQDLQTVILDEIHAVVDSKRGVHLMSAVERLVPLSGEFQRIALSATMKPLEKIAAYIGGYIPTSDGYTPRQVGIVNARQEKRFDISVRYPEETSNRPRDDKIWDSLAHDFYARIAANRSTLLFVNSRSLAEKITLKINEVAQKTVAYAHHGSLSRELRLEVERKLKNGDLKAIVATSTLEMGIDIGELDEVLLIQSPDNIASAIQRIGRAGHSVGQVSRCTIYPTHPMDFVHAAVLSQCVEARDIEPIRTIECPLDVLAQIIISMTGIAEWDLDELFDEVRRSSAFQRLTRIQFDLVIGMLAGRYAQNRIRELKPRVNIDRLENRIKARPGALMSLYLSGGVIADRGYFQIRLEDSGSRIGELDEEFVWEANVGQVFSFGTQHWQVRKVTHNDVIVAPAKPGASAPPFWKSESLNRNFHFSERIGEFLEQADQQLDDADYPQRLQDQFAMETEPATELIRFLQQQRQHCNARLPHRRHLLVEHIHSAPGGARAHQIVFHTLWGSQINRPVALAMEAAWFEEHGEQPEIYVDNDCLVLQLQEHASAVDLLAAIQPERLEDYLRLQLESSGFFGARFRENAGIALLLSKGRFNERKPLWMSRMQSKKLLDSVKRYPDFPLLLETWRTCLQDEFDIPQARELLAEIRRGDIQVTEVESASPSPFARNVAWGQISSYMYLDDQPRNVSASNLRPDLLEEVVFSPGIRPAVPVELCREFEARRQRLVSGYEPETTDEIIEWVKERSAIPLEEWQQLIGSLELNESRLADKLTWANPQVIVARENLSLLSEDPAVLLGNLLQFHGPVTSRQLALSYALDETAITTALQTLADDRLVICGQLIVDDQDTYWCDADNYEALLRFFRLGNRYNLAPSTLGQLTPFLYHWQTRDRGEHALADTIDKLRCFGCAPEMWEMELLPSRLPGYQSRDMDLLLQDGDLLWLGCDEKQISLCWRDDMDLPFSDPPEEPDALTDLFPDRTGRYDFGTMLDSSGADSAELATRLWQEVWQSRVSNDSFGSLRKGIETGFKLPASVALASGSARGSASSQRPGHRSRPARRGFNQWRNAMPFAGNWFRIAYPPAAQDLLEREELAKDRVRVLLDRYGIVFRELLQRESAAFQWRQLFRSLRLMELSGEVIAGYFFTDIPGPQFASPAAVRLLGDARPSDSIFWINATDPISLCGAGLINSKLPRRISSNHLVYHGDDLVMVSERLGKSLTINVPADNPQLVKYLEILRHLQYRPFKPVRKLVIESINEQPVTESPYLAALETFFEVVRDYKTIYLQRDLV